MDQGGELVVTAESPLTRFDAQTRDPELAHQLLRDTYVDFIVRSSGSVDGFEYAISGTVAPTFTTARLRYSMASELDSQVSATSVYVNLCPDGHLACASGRDRAVAGPEHPILMPPDEPGWQVEMEDVTVDSVTLDKDAVDRAARSLFGSDVPGVRFTSMVPISPTVGRCWSSVVAHVRNDVLAHDEVAASPLIMANTTRQLASALLVTFPNSGLSLVDEHAPARRAEPAALRRALAYIDEHAEEDVSVDDIATAARLGVRGLQGLFRRHRDCTPLEELRRVRMARAHAALLAADPTRGDTVSAIAARWGFGHPGRFSVDYRRAYGSSPSDTLRR